MQYQRKEAFEPESALYGLRYWQRSYIKHVKVVPVVSVID
jgi:hypothetical protein